MISSSLLAGLRDHPEPAVRYFALTNLFQLDSDSAELYRARIALPKSPIIQQLCAFNLDLQPYNKWNGAHWRLVQLAELGYPYINPRLQAPRDQVYTWLFSESHLKSIHMIEGRTRRCASQEANAIYASLKLNLVTNQTEKLVRSLLAWQWQDGGWNCDKRPQASHSSFWETWTPLRALLSWREYAGTSPELEAAITHATELFLRKRLYLRESTGEPMQAEFTRLRHPSYWKYDILVGLELMQAAAKLDDPRCEPALALLESKMHEDGGFCVEDKKFQATNPNAWHYSPVDWGSTSARKANPWLTVRALTLLKAAGRITFE